MPIVFWCLPGCCLPSYKDFPVPTDAIGVKSLLGLTNQLPFFIPDHIQNSKALRELCGKYVTFNWLPEHQFEFETIKTILSANLLNQHFDPSKDVFLLTNASRHHGLGFALCQKTSEGHLYIVTCASQSLTDTQRRYSTIELECLAIKWAILKCPFYLLGLPKFTVVIDHRPLEGVFKKAIFDLPNPRLQRMRDFSKCLSGLRDRLSVSEDIILLDCKRIVVPGTAVSSILGRLHVGHCGQDKTLKLAQSLFYWPGKWHLYFRRIMQSLFSQPSKPSC